MARLQIKEAEAYAERKILEVNGEMNALLSRYEAYKKAERVTRVRLYLEALETVLARCERKILLDESVKGILPHLDLSGQKGGGR